jgi:hypothetical protein
MAFEHLLGPDEPKKHVWNFVEARCNRRKELQKMFRGNYMVALARIAELGGSEADERASTSGAAMKKTACTRETTTKDTRLV